MSTMIPRALPVNEDVPPGDWAGQLPMDPGMAEPLPMGPMTDEEYFLQPFDDEEEAGPEGAAGQGDLGFDPDADDETIFAQGQEFVGQMPGAVEAQEQWDALPRWMKDLRRAASAGVQFSQADVARAALSGMAEQRRQEAMAKEPEVVEMEGRKFIKTATGSLQPIPEKSARMKDIVAEDGTRMLLDMESGVARPVLDDRGNPVRSQQGSGGPAGLVQASGMNLALRNFAKNQVKLAEIERRMVEDGPDATDGFMGPKLSKRRMEILQEMAADEAVINAGMHQQAEQTASDSIPTSEATPSPTPAATPNRTPSPTPAATPTPTATPSPTPMPEWVRQNGRVFRRQGDGYVLVE